MEIKTCPLDPGLTIAEVILDDGSTWHFLPFEDRTAKLHRLNERYILALGQSKAVAIFDTKERHRTILIPNLNYVADRWCFREICGSLFLQEWVKLPYDSPGEIALRKISADGSYNQRVDSEIDMPVAKLLVRSDGCIILVGRKQTITFDPDSSEFRVWPFGEYVRLIDYGNLDKYRKGDDDFRWFSDDARYGVRLKLEPAVTSNLSWGQRSKAGRAIGQLLKNMGLRFQSGNLHPDLPGDGTPQRGLAIEIFQLAPFKLMKTIVVRYFPEASFETKFVMSHDRAILTRDELAKKRKSNKDYSVVYKHYPQHLRMRLKDIEWPANSNDFRVCLVEQTREGPSIRFYGFEKVDDISYRTISLSGKIGPLEFASGEAKPRNFDSLPSDKAINAIKKIVRERSNHHIDCDGLTGASVACALKSVRQLIQSQGLEKLVFNGQLRFKFRLESKLISEKRFFEAVRQMPSEAAKELLPELRELLLFYGAEARKFTLNGASPIMSSASEQGSAALSEAALTLATLDDEGFDALRNWVVSVDQEHDYFSAKKVFPAFAKATDIKTPEAIRFGIWFFLQQWQTVTYRKNWLGLFDQAKEAIAPRQFAVLVAEEWAGVAEFLSEKWAGPVYERVEDVLGTDDWSQEALRELNKLRDKGAI